MEAIKTIELTKMYGQARGIDHLDLKVEAGDFFGFIGPNGAGKSTTIRTLLGLMRPTSGTGEIFGLDIVQQREMILQKTGYLPSEAIFYPNMKVKDILEFSSRLRKMDCQKEAKYLCERLQLDPFKKIETLSLGNRKKVAIVCALQHRPDLLILDEPTTGLDPLMQKVFFDILHERNQEGTTIFLSSHVLSEIQRHCTRAAIIREGKIIACDTIDVLAKTKAKRVNIHGSVAVDTLTGIRDLKEGKDTLSFLYSGDMLTLLHTLSTGDVQDLSISEPDLEEIFLHYYEKEENI